MSTPHINAQKGDFASVVLMPGDPLRSKFIAENFLSSARLVNNVRAVQGYIGVYKGVPISVMASGMGIPSMAIYSHELFGFFGVEAIIRIGSAGAIADGIELRDLVAAQAACSNSNFARSFCADVTLAPIADYSLLRGAERAAERLGIALTVGNLYSSDTFYDERTHILPTLRGLGVLAVEMETAALYLEAMRAGKKALTLCTISDKPLTGESLSAKEREVSFTDMMRVALETAATQ